MFFIRLSQALGQCRPAEKRGLAGKKIASEKRWEERREEPVSIFLITSVLLLPQKPFLVSRWQNLW